MTPPHRVGLDGDVEGLVPSWIGYEHPDRLISYPDLPYLSGYALPIRMCVREAVQELRRSGRSARTE